MHSWKEFDLTPTGIEDWLSWYALTRESVMQCKDGSLLGFLRYDPFLREDRANEQWNVLVREFSRGWTMWLETIYAEGEETHTLSLSWNPFLSMGGKVENMLAGNPLELSQAEAAFEKELYRIAKSFPKEAGASVLTYQGIIDHLMQTLTLGRYHREMPEVPIDLDVLLTADLPFDFSTNHVKLGDEVFLILSVPSAVGMVPGIARAIAALQEAAIPFRHVERVLFFNKEEAQKEYTKYMARWCPARQYMQDFLTDGLMGVFYGWFNHHLIALVPEGKYAHIAEQLTKVFQEEEMLFLLEDFNAKDYWWGSLPAMFRAGLKPPICSFQALEDLLVTKGKEARNVSA